MRRWPARLARRRLPALGLAALWPCAPVAATPQVPAGRVERLANFPSRHVPARHVDVWLPDGLRRGDRPAVLYMHDGQMLFDARGSWNSQSWDLAATAQRLIDAGRVRPFIVVGIWNHGPNRFAEYLPEGLAGHLGEARVREALLSLGPVPRALSGAYLRFLVEELVPAVQARFVPAKGREHTFVAGSSMGGLISLAALLEHPQRFGGAACLSTHWILRFEANREVPDAALAWLRERLPAPGRHRLWLDRGTVGLDSLYQDAQQRVDALLRERGFRPPLLRSKVFEGAEHTERDWAARVEQPLLHLLGR